MKRTPTGGAGRRSTLCTPATSTWWLAARGPRTMRMPDTAVAASPSATPGALTFGAS
ncbi:hypothetical protein [Enterococcus hirae]|uniref:hypothetical protein n=1 Tax=Enterococcus hirae TaxID=1354 RepID=UPI00136B36D1|nr:hypothetical protein [Enterococcus hirae]NAE18227.1 hypothetical protein [Enterococcus hirae]